jgi:hypothetical protein
MNEYNGAYKTFAPNWKRILSNACGRNLGCLSRQDSSDAGYLSAFGGRVQAIAMPPSAARSPASPGTSRATQAPA